MNVKNILAAKGSDIVGIEPNADLAAAAQLLSKHKIGAVVIRGAGGRLAGILSERDIVRALAEHGAEAMTLQVAKVMTRNVVTCGEDDNIASIMEQMTAGKFRHLPVVTKGELVGLVSIGDIVKQRLGEIEQESEQLRDTSGRPNARSRKVGTGFRIRSRANKKATSRCRWWLAPAR